MTPRRRRRWATHARWPRSGLALDRRGAHAQARRLLAERMDGPLSAVAAHQLIQHLERCAGCRSVERAYQDGRHQLGQLRPTVVPRDLGARVFAALDREMAGGSGRLRRPDLRGRSGAGLAVPVAGGALAVVALVVGARLLLAPVATMAGPDATTAARPDPTPFAVPTGELALVEQGSDGLTVYQTAVSEVCPSTATDCAITDHVARRIVGIASDLVPRGLAMDRQSRRMALLAEDALGADSVSVVTLAAIDDRPDPVGAGPGPDGRWPVPGSSAAALALASQAPTGSGLPAPSSDPTAPARVLAILEGVEAVGAPPAWSPDGTMLAFSAMPMDRSRGPDIYLWRPGDSHAHRVTADHRSWFASWSGARLVLSRMPRGDGRDLADTVLLDPADGTEEAAAIRGAWLPAVDPSGRFAVAWHGTLTGGLASVRPRTGDLALIDWGLVDPDAVTVAGSDPGGEVAAGRPFAVRRALGADPARSTRGRTPTRSPSPWLESIEPATGEGPAALDWQVQWATSGTTFGYWVADAHGASWGRLTVLRVLPETRTIDRDATLLGPTLARRSFTLGDERIAWVAPAEEGADGELRVRTWGLPGEGNLRIRDIRLRDGIPAF